MCKLITPATHACSGRPRTLGGDALASILPVRGCPPCQMQPEDPWLHAQVGKEGPRLVSSPETRVGGLKGWAGPPLEW